MTDKAQFNLAGISQHIIQYTCDGVSCFYSLDDNRQYLDDLRFSASECNCRIHAYVLMPDQVQLLVTPMVERGVLQMMCVLNERYEKYIHAISKRTRPLWDEPYRASLIESDIYLLACMCYLELHPVRARLVEHPEDYRWSSYHQNTQHLPDALVCYHPVFSQLGETLEERQFVYRELFKRYLDDDAIHQIRDALQHERVLGRAAFKERVERLVGRLLKAGVFEKPFIKEERADYYVV